MRFVPIVCVLSTPKIEIIDHAQKTPENATFNK